MSSLQLKLNPGKWISSTNYILFCLMMFFKAYGDAMLANDQTLGEADNIKYYILIIASLLAFIQILRNRRKGSLYVKDLKAFLLLLLVWSIISLVTSVNAVYPNTESLKYWLYIIMPFFYSYSIINTTDEKTVFKYFKAALIISLGCYLIFEKGSLLFTADNFALISFADSVSPFESSFSAGSSITACAFFAYYRKGNRAWLVLSMIFCFLTFKRASVLMMFVYFFYPILFNKDKTVKKKWIVFQAAAVTGATIATSLVLLPKYFTSFEELLGIDLNQLLMGRGRLYGVLVNSGYKTAGLGTSLDHMKYLARKAGGIELELVQLLWETTIIGLVFFVIYSYKLARGHAYCLLIISFMMFNMLTSTSLGNPFSWILTYMTVWSIIKHLTNDYRIRGE